MPGETLYTATSYFQPFPDARDVFASRVEEHARVLLPLATVELSHLFDDLAGPLHFVVPIEPEDVVVGEDTEAAHTFTCRANWIGYRVTDGQYELDCGFDYFQPEAHAEHYALVREGFALRARHFAEHGCLHHPRATPDARGRLDESDRVELVYDLGGVSTDGNWANMDSDYPIRTEPVTIDGEEWTRALPQTEDGRDYRYIGALSMHHYVAEAPAHDYLLEADLLLFYDPADGIALTTFDWS